MDQPTGAATVNTYDLADQMVSSENDGQPVLTATHSNQAVMSYDAAGNAIASVDQAGNTTNTTFDGDNRVQQSVAVTGTSTITTTDQYDPDATAITQTTQTYTGTGGIETHVVTATVNAADWQVSAGQDGVPTNYGYDAAGQVRTQTVLTGTVPITMTLDAEGRETALAAGIPGTPVYTDTTAYNANDLPVTLTLNSGTSQVQEIAGYDPNSRLTSWHDPGPGQNVTYSYGYDAANRVTSFTAVSGTDTITHDPATGRLTADCGPQSVVQTTHCYAWSYDGNGNITRAIDDTGVTQYFTYSLTQPNELAQSSAAGYPDVAYSYDGSGNTTLISTTSIASGNPLQIHTQLGYDPQGRISSVTDINGTVARIGYNAAGERNSYAVTTSGGQQLYSAQFSYQSGQLAQASVVSATAGGGSVSYLDTYLYNQDGTPQRFTRQENGTTNTYWYETDGRGDVVAVTDNTGAVVDSYEYDLWGEFLPGTTHEKVIQPLKYAGYWYDPAVTWYWVDGRYYDPELERYLQPDGSSARSYVYAGDDPVDANGLSGNAGLSLNGYAGLTFNGYAGFGTGGSFSGGISNAAPNAETPPGSGGSDEIVPPPVGGGGEGGGGEVGPGEYPPLYDEFDVENLIADSNPGNRLTRINSVNVLRSGPNNTTAVVSGPPVKGVPQVPGADVVFYDEQSGAVAATEVKCITSLNNFSSQVSDGVDQFGKTEEFIGARIPQKDLFVQLPQEGSTTEEADTLLSRFRGISRPDISKYGNVSIRIADRVGHILYSGPLFK